MSQDKDHIERLKDYLSDHMTPQERHRLEREALEDAFLQEALEGYETAGAERLADIEGMARKIKKERAYPVWYRYASAAVLLVASSLLVYLFIDLLHPSEDLSMTRTPTEEAPSSTAPPSLKKDAIMDIKTKENTVDGLPNQENLQKKPDVSPQKKESNGARYTEVSRAKTRHLSTQVQQAQAVKAADVRVKAPMPVEEEMMLDIQAYPSLVAQTPFGEASAPLMRNSSAEDTIGAKREGQFSPALAAFVAPQPDESMPSSKERFLDIAASQMREIGTNPDTISTFGKKSSAQPKPKNGFAQYTKYLEENLIYPAAAKENKVEGTVVLLAIIGKDGSIGGIQVKKSLGYGCDLEAIRLVKEGPKWVPAVKKGKAVKQEVKIKVKFRDALR